MSSYTIYRVATDEEGNETGRSQVETFAEAPAPAVTLGGRLLALRNETGAEHIAVASDG